MRKIITCLFLVAMVFSLCFSANTTEYSDPLDSRNIPAELLNLADPDEGDILFRFYSIPILFEFAKKDSIEAILEEAAEDSPFYALETSDGQRIIFEDRNNGTSYEIIDQHYQGYWPNPSFQEHRTGEAIRAISPDIIIESMFYLTGENSLMGTAIYYKTNLGDYVFFIHWSIGERLFSAEAFFEYQRAAYAKSTQNGDALGADFYSGWDLSVYDYRSPDFNPDAPFPKLDPVDSLPSTPVSDPDITEVDQENPLYFWIGISAGVLLLTAFVTFLVLKSKRRVSSEKQ